MSTALTINIGALPEPGDASAYGDGKGQILDLEWSYGKGWISLHSAQPGVFEVSVPIEDAGATLPISVRAIGTAGPGAPSVPVHIAIPGDPSVFPVTVNGEPVTIDGAPVVVTLTIAIT